MLAKTSGDKSACDIVLPPKVGTATPHPYNVESFGSGDVMISCPDENNQVPKPYPVQPGFEKIKSRLDTRISFDPLTGIYRQAGTGEIDNTQLYFVITNIVQAVDDKSLADLISQNPTIVRKLFSPDGVNSAGVLHLCAVRGIRELLDTVVTFGAQLVDVDIRNGNGETPLHLACRRGILRTVRYFVEKGASITAVDSQGNTCAHFAAQSGSSTVLQMLFELGLDLNLKNGFGLTAAHLLVQTSHNQCLQFLLKYRRIDPSVPDANKHHLLDYALSMGEANQVALLVEYFPSLIKSMKPLPNLQNEANWKRRMRIETAVEVVKYADTPLWKRNLSYFVMTVRNLITICMALALNHVFGALGALVGGAGVALDCYYTYNSSHRLSYDRRPSPYLAGAFATGLFFTCVASLQVALYSSVFMTSWPVHCYTVTSMLIVWSMYLTLMLRGSKGANNGTPFTGKMWEVAYDERRQKLLCLLCYSETRSDTKSKHCRLCEVCVGGMDHHCLYLLCCIGSHNHRLFVLFAISTLIAQVSFVCMALMFVHDDLLVSTSTVNPSDFLTDHYLLLLCLPPNIISAVWGTSFINNQLKRVSRLETSYFQNSISPHSPDAFSPSKRLSNLVHFFLTGHVQLPPAQHDSKA